jgi:hypothetical protein
MNANLLDRNKLISKGIFDDIDKPCHITLNSECDFYGASLLISRRKIFSRANKQSRLTGFWTHGWVYLPFRFAELYRWHDAPIDWPLLVHREEEKRNLLGLGISNVHVVGAPFIYCPDRVVQRLPKSLLIMPFHSLDYVKQKYLEDEYFEALAPEIEKFDVVAACVHPSCIRSRRWIEGLQKRSIPYVTGAEATDKNGLLRIKQIMSRFTHVTSNWIGSHIVYAAYCGCSVSICGPRPIFNEHDFVDDPFYKNHPEILGWWLTLENSEWVCTKYAFLFRKPHEAEPCKEWALSRLGHENKRSAADVASLLSAHEYSKKAIASNARLSKVVTKIKGSFDRVRSLMRFCNE